MRGNSHTPWERASQIAATQWGSVTGRQLARCGLSGDAVERAVHGRRLFRPHAAVYTFGHLPVLPKPRAMAAVLSCGPTAQASHLWCLWLFELIRHAPEGPVDVTTRHLSGRTDVRLHRTRVALPRDRQDGIPVTRPERGILDSVRLLSEKQLRRAVNTGQIEGLFTAETLREMCAASPGRKTAALTALVPLDQRGATRSMLEDLLLDLLRTEGWRMEVNAVVERIECDFVFPQQRRIIQAEGWTFHGTRIAFENDREIQLTLQAAGWEVTPVTYRMVTAGWSATRRRLLRLLG